MKSSPDDLGDDLGDVVDVARDFIRSCGAEPGEVAGDFAEALVKLADSCVVGAPCVRHYGSVHGQEAEELRRGIERLIRDAESDAIGSRTVSVFSLQRLLDEVNARDSLAFLEATDGEDDDEDDGEDRAIWDAELAVRAEAARQALVAQGIDLYQIVADAFGLSRGEAERRFCGVNSVTAAT